MLAQKLRDLQRILDMPLHPHMQGLDAGDGEERVHRRERRAEVAQATARAFMVKAKSPKFSKNLSP